MLFKVKAFESYGVEWWTEDPHCNVKDKDLAYIFNSESTEDMDNFLQDYEKVSVYRIVVVTEVIKNQEMGNV